jgi:excisionase family DNA binding protein
MAGEAVTMSIKEVSDDLGVSRQTVYRMIADGRLKAERRGYVKSRQFRVLSESVAALKRGERAE